MARPIEKHKNPRWKLIYSGLLGLCVANAMVIGVCSLWIREPERYQRFVALCRATPIGRLVIYLFPGHYVAAFAANSTFFGLLGAGTVLYWIKRGKLLENEAGPTANQSEEK